MARKSWRNAVRQSDVRCRSHEPTRLRSKDAQPGKGGYFKDERSLGGEGGRSNAVSISNNDIMV